MASYTQFTMVHRLPKARRVDRIDHLVDLARGRSVVHLGFADAGCAELQQSEGTWLHERLAGVATQLVGLDIDPVGVEAARAAGHDAVAVDCTDPDAVRVAAIEPATLVIAGEVIEHFEHPGGFFAAADELVAPGGLLVVTTPNAYGLLNVFASLLHREINHPDHVVMFTWRTLSALAGRHGWVPVDTSVYVPSVKQMQGRGLRARLMRRAAAVACAIERVACAFGRTYAADGLIVCFRRRAEMTQTSRPA